jgi:glycosyltransferase involved in cell wall biosynthesis
MKIVHVYQSGETAMLGVERYVLNLAAEQMARGSSVTVITQRPGLLAQASHQHGVPMIVAEDLKWGMKPAGPMSEPGTRWLASQLRSLNADLINCHTVAAAPTTIAAARSIRIPFIFTIHAMLSDRPHNAAGPIWGQKFAAISVSRRNFETLKRNGFPEADLYYIPSGTKAASPAGLPNLSHSRHPNLIFVGDLARHKGLDIALLALAELRKRHGADCPRLNLYGSDTSDAVYINEMVAILDLADIAQFRGFQAGILDRCPSSDILVMPSRQETGPLVVLEAMSRGMPIAASDVGEVAAMLPDRQYGRIVPVDSPTALANALDSLLSDIAKGHFDPQALIERHR